MKIRPCHQPARNGRQGRARKFAAFTMIEIALCLAIIGFGLVAIIGVLPTGLNVQRNNREETIIDQDAVVWMNAIRGGAQGYDDLTNYVTSIAIYWAAYSTTNVLPTSTGLDTYTRSNSAVSSVAGVPPSFRLYNGGIIIGLLSTPKYTVANLPPGTLFQSNYVVAYVRSMSGPAVEKFPQNNADILEDAFNYRLVTELVSYVPFDPNGTNISLVPTNQASNRLRMLSALQKNSTDVRLFFRWPILPSGVVGNSRQTFRLLSGGTQTNLNILNWPPLYFLQHANYAQAQ
jgi:type II secretory pathway pseudopilin PulG